MGFGKEKLSSSSEKIRKYLRAASALGFCALAFITANDSLSNRQLKTSLEPMAGLADSPPKIEFSESLLQEVFAKHRPLKSLPDFGDKVSPEQEQEVEDSTLKMGYRYENGAMVLFCSASKVTMRGITGFLTAKHCFEDPLTSTASPDQFEFYDPKILPYGIAVAKGLKVIKDPGNSDYAFVVPNPATELTADTFQPSGSPRTRLYAEIPSLSYKGSIKPIPAGSQAYMFSPGSATLNKPVKALGIDLGRVRSDDNRQYDVIGYNSDPKYPACSAGSSGDNGETAGSYTVGPLTAGVDAWNDKKGFRIISDLLELDTHGLNEFCLTNVPAKNTISTIVRLASK